MRTIPMVIIATIMIASIATTVYVLRDHPSIASTSTVAGPDAPTREGSRDHPTPLEQPRLTLLQEQVAALEARLHTMEAATREPSPRRANPGPGEPDSNPSTEKAKAHKRLTLLQEQVATLLQKQIAALEARLHTMEAATREPSPRQADPGPGEPDSNPGADTATAHKWSEADFVQWMDAALDAGDIDRHLTASVMEQAERSFAEVPGINLADLQCASRFCRATLMPKTGEPLDMAQLLGASPFMGSGTTIHEPDGSVSVYFVQPGESFDELRGEAQATAQ